MLLRIQTKKSGVFGLIIRAFRFPTVVFNDPAAISHVIHIPYGYLRKDLVGILHKDRVHLPLMVGICSIKHGICLHTVGI